MKNELINITLPEGKFNDINSILFEENDRSILYEIYLDWRNLSNNLKQIGGRGVNLPEGLSESAFCLEMGCIKITHGIPKANTSWDCYNPYTNKRIQIKACSVLPDLTSFGPNSVWDELYFLDFYNEGLWDGTFKIYKIESNLIYNHKVNQNQTFKEQQDEKRRPRFSIYKELILPNNIQPIKICDLSRGLNEF